MKKLPKLYRTVKAQFWSLRGSVGESLGFVEVDKKVTRSIRRVRCKEGWKWQIALDHKNQLDWDLCYEVDQSCLDELGLTGIEFQ